MPRSARVQSSVDLYHVCNRGMDRRQIFFDDSDRKKYLEYVAEGLERTRGALLAWCLMDNHMHFVANMRIEELAKFMQYVTGSYATYSNKKRGRDGYLFQGRYKSQPIEDASYLLNAVRYVHQNPQKARICSTDVYRWSSYREYLTKPKFVDTRMVLGEFGSKDAYAEFHRELVNDRTFIDVDTGWRMHEEEAYAVACEVLGEKALGEFGYVNSEIRDKRLRKLLAAQLSPTNISKITGIPKTTVYHAADGM